MAEIVLPYKWKPRSYQMHAWRYFQGPEEGKRGAAVWHRRAGKDLFAINLCSVKSMERVGLYWHLLPTYKQGRAIVWNGSTRDGRKFLDHFHPDLIKSKNGTEMSVDFVNGSRYQVVGTDDIDSLVGTNPIGCVFSEYSLHDPGAWEYIRPILLENGGWALFIYTPRGKNHGFTMKEMAKKNERWLCSLLTAGDGPNSTKRDDGRPVISDEMIQQERNEGVEEAMIQQEYFISFDAPLTGAYYGTQMANAEKEKRICGVPHEPRLPVDTWWDLGMDDSTTIVFTQRVGQEEHVIDYYENSGEGLAHYAKAVRGQLDGMFHRQEYTYGTHNAPHDIEVRELGTGKSRRETAASLGLKFRVVKKHDVEDGIEQVRNVLPQCWFDLTRCERLINALSSYTKEYDEKRKVYKNHPCHDWSSHGADAFRMFAMGRKDRVKRDKKIQQDAVDEHNYLSI